MDDADEVEDEAVAVFVADDVAVVDVCWCAAVEGVEAVPTPKWLGWMWMLRPDEDDDEDGDGEERACLLASRSLSSLCRMSGCCCCGGGCSVCVAVCVTLCCAWYLTRLWRRLMLACTNCCGEVDVTLLSASASSRSDSLQLLHLSR